MKLALSSSSEFFSLAVYNSQDLMLTNCGFFTKKLQKWSISSVENLLKTVEMSLKDLTIIAVDTGPGKFTGLRVGVAMAKTMAFALGIDMVEACSLDIIRSDVPALMPVIVAMDGKQNRVFTKVYNANGTTGEVLDIEPGKLKYMIEAEGLHHYTMVGDGFKNYSELQGYPINEIDYFFYPKAWHMHKVWSEPKNKLEVDARYYRKTQAEERRK